MTVTRREERRAKQRRNASESGSQRENKTNKSGAKRSLRGQPKHCAKHQMNVTLFPLDCIVNGEHAVQVNDLFLPPLVLFHSAPSPVRRSFVPPPFLPSILFTPPFSPRPSFVPSTFHGYPTQLSMPYTTYRLPTKLFSIFLLQLPLLYPPPAPLFQPTLTVLILVFFLILPPESSPVNTCHCRAAPSLSLSLSLSLSHPYRLPTCHQSPSPSPHIFVFPSPSLRCFTRFVRDMLCNHRFHTFINSFTY